MQILTILSALLLSGSALAIRATYDNTYDNPHGSMNSVACSNGENGLVGGKQAAPAADPSVT